ncbi:MULTISPECIES: fimbrial protein [Serratia]|uniref:Fimbrial protein n=2 Tax=Serratia TaxID=613 RepID=A0AAW6XAL3_9GAMM|nr:MULTISPECIES: fimbrial protein [Serratia]AKL42307.1 hypothetical protein AB188_17875 [Serratia marcescens]AVU36937.1 hypothetical protein AM681_20995 [Serratia marcescens]AVU42065.1 hypothetical protein AS658_20980 [Serratia marcescens]AWL69608.1 hypothetical protein DKC05_19130 [Serratia marcescens]EIJ7464664.1 fimbrial protein [Serratia marcescens]
MKKYLVASALACAAISSSAFAADGVINFTGKIVDNACIVDPTLNVQMGDVAAAAFKNVGDEAQEQSRLFSLDLKDCPANLKTATVQLDGEADADNKDLFKLTAGGATGLALRIKGPSQDIVPGGKSEALELKEGTNSLTLLAVYKSTDKVTAGDANATIQFSVSYN